MLTLTQGLYLQRPGWVRAGVLGAVAVVDRRDWRQEWIPSGARYDFWAVWRWVTAPLSPGQSDSKFRTAGNLFLASCDHFVHVIKPQDCARNTTHTKKSGRKGWLSCSQIGKVAHRQESLMSCVGDLGPGMPSPRVSLPVEKPHSFLFPHLIPEFLLRCTSIGKRPSGQYTGAYKILPQRTITLSKSMTSTTPQVLKSVPTSGGFCHPQPRVPRWLQAQMIPCHRAVSRIALSLPLISADIGRRD